MNLEEKKHILIVDDDDRIRELIKEYLENNKGAGGIQIGLKEDTLIDRFKALCEDVVSLKAIH